jgi:hypothetical protein
MKSDKYFPRLTSHVLRLTVFISLLALAGCNGNITGSASGTNADLNAVHRDGPDCTQSGCHPGFGAAGTVFTNVSGVPISGVLVKATNTSNLQTTAIGTTDTLGNFHYEGSLSGNFQMVVGSRQSGIYVHKLPADRGCNSCHKWPSPTGGAPGRLSA